MSISEISKVKSNLLFTNLIKDLKKFLHGNEDNRTLDEIIESYRISRPMVENAPFIEGHSYTRNGFEILSVKLYVSFLNPGYPVFSQAIEVK